MVDLKDGADAATILATLTATTTTVLGGSGNDTIRVGGAGGNVDSIAARVVVDGGADWDVLIADDSGETNPNSGTVTGDTIGGLDMGDAIVYRAVEALSVALGSGADALLIISTHAGSTSVSSGGGDDTINVRTISGATSVHGGSGSDTINVGSLAPGVGGGLRGISAALNVVGSVGHYTLNVDARAHTAWENGDQFSVRF